MDIVLHELFGTDIGLLSLFTIGFIIVMGLYLWAKLSKKSHEKN